MDAERARAFLLTLPHTVETMQWGDNLVFWVGDKAAGGKMFALINLDTGAGLLKHGVVSLAVGKERAAELLEVQGMFPAPYLARAGWVAAEQWGVLRAVEWETELLAAHDGVLRRMPAWARKALDLAANEAALTGKL